MKGITILFTNIASGLKLAAALFVLIVFSTFPTRAQAVPFDYTLDVNTYLTWSVFDYDTIWTCLTSSMAVCQRTFATSDAVYFGGFDLNSFTFIDDEELLRRYDSEDYSVGEQQNVIGSLFVQIGVRDDSNSFWDFGERGILATYDMAQNGCDWSFEIDTSTRTCEFTLALDYEDWGNWVFFGAGAYLNDFRMDFVRVYGDYEPVHPSQVPEPGTLALFGLGLVGIGFSRRRKA